MCRRYLEFFPVRFAHRLSTALTMHCRKLNGNPSGISLKFISGALL